MQTTYQTISIHALRVEGDKAAPRRLSFPEISIHALRVEGDLFVNGIDPLFSQFLSTPSGWRATSRITSTTLSSRFLSTPSGWRATIQILNMLTPILFLSTPSGWRATVIRFLLTT